MASTLSLSLTDELRAFVDQNSGDGTLYSTPSVFARSLLREKKERMGAARLRDAIIEGYQDVVAGRGPDHPACRPRPSRPAAGDGAGPGAELEMLHRKTAGA